MKNPLRYLRLILSLFCLLSGSAFANYSAVPTTTCTSSGRCAGSQSAACQLEATHFGWTVKSSSPLCNIGNPVNGANNDPGIGYYYAGHTCPNGGTLSGTTCVHSCPQGQTEQTDGSCTTPPPVCPSGQAGQIGIFGGWSIGPGINAVVGQPQYSTTMCDGTCLQSVTSIAICGSDPGGSVDSPKAITCTGVTTSTGAQCSQRDVPTAGAPPVIPTKKPPCDASEGVLTSSTGAVKCVPAGTPSAEKPAVWTNKKESVAADGTRTETTETTTRDRTTGAESSSSTTKTYPPGCTGEACASTSTDSKSKDVVPDAKSGTGEKGDQSSDFCVKNPNMQICKGGMNEEETQKKVEENTKAIAESLDGSTTDNDEITNKESDPAKVQEATDAYQAMQDKLTGGTDAAGDQASFSSELSTWFDPIPAGSCSPISSQIGPWTWAFDPCPIAQKVSDIAAYALWVFLAFSSFALVTRKAE